MAYRISCELFQKPGDKPYSITGTIAFGGNLMIKDYSGKDCKGVLTDLEDDFEIYEYSTKRCPYEEWKKLPEHFTCKMRREVPMLMIHGRKDEVYKLFGEIHESDSADKNTVQPPVLFSQ